jgi:predicted metal-dependent peptidase
LETSELQRQISKISIQWLLEEPFFAHIIGGLSKSLNDQVAEIGLALQEDFTFVLAINPTFWSSLSTQEQQAVIKHEVLHLLFLHPITKRDYWNERLFDTAADLAINQYIAHLPAHYVQLDDFKYLDLLPQQSVDYYYQKLQNHQEEIASSQVQHQHWPNQENTDSAKADVAAINLKRFLRQLSEHLTEKELERYGVGAQTAVLALRQMNKPRVNWRRLLRIYQSSSQKTYLKNTIQRPSKRFGTIPGIKVKRHTKVGVAIDTSGSLQMEAFYAFFGEIHAMWRGANEIQVVECDECIQKIYPYKGKTPEYIQGRGSTNFDEPIEWANQHRMDVLLYFTDGYGPKPKVLNRMPIIWLITESGIQPSQAEWDQLPGKKLKLTA